MLNEVQFQSGLIKLKRRSKCWSGSDRLCGSMLINRCQVYWWVGLWDKVPQKSRIRNTRWKSNMWNSWKLVWTSGVTTLFTVTAALFPFSVTEFRGMGAADKTFSYVTVRARGVHAGLHSEKQNRESSGRFLLNADPESATRFHRGDQRNCFLLD